MLVLKNIKKSFGSKKVLKGVNFHAERGKITVLCGPNGAGKTTLIRIILRLLREDEGSLNIDTSYSSIGFIFHNDILFKELTLKENIKFFLKSKKKALREEMLKKYLLFFKLDGDFDTKISKFSAGMKRKAELLRVILEEPEFLILDEPTSNLDPLVKVEIRKLLLELNRKEGLTIFMTSHNLDEVEKIGDKILILNDGIISWEGERETLEKEGVELEDKFLEVVKGGN